MTPDTEKAAGGRERKKRERVSKADRAIIARAAHLRSLLAEFGVTLAGFDPGVTANIIGKPAGSPGMRGAGFWGEHLSFSAREWGWLEPLLIELRERRGHAR
jgi:hypothetical protein